MQDTQNTILPDHKDRLVEQFKHIDYLISNDKLDNAAELLLELHHADLADFLDNSTKKTYHTILPAIAEHINPETIVCLSDSNKQKVLEALGVKESSKLVNNMDLEDAIEVIEDLDHDFKDALIDGLSLKKRQQIIEGFKYPENTAGRALEKNFVSFQQNWTVGQAIDYVRKGKIDTDFHAAIIVNSKQQPVGTILLSTLLKSQTSTHIADIMNSEFKVADTHTELSELGFIFKQYALTIVPVTNRQGKLVGSISIDNMLYIIAEQAESEFMHLGGVHNSDIFYDMYETAKHRFPWLFVNLITACITSIVINQFSDTIAKLITLATIMPIVASMGGNAGTQVMTVTVRALASREINSANMFKVISKEILVCSFNGVLLAGVGVILTYLLFSEFDLSIIFASAVILNFAIAGLLGSITPIILNKIHIDPATASGVFLTAFTDAIGFFSFLGLAYFFLI